MLFPINIQISRGVNNDDDDYNENKADEAYNNNHDDVFVYIYILYFHYFQCHIKKETQKMKDKTENEKWHVRKYFLLYFIFVWVDRSHKKRPVSFVLFFL